MVIMRFKVKVRPEKAEDVRSALEAVIEPSRALEGPLRQDAFVATEVYDSKSVLDRQEELPEVEAALALIRESVVEREATLYDVTAAER